MNIGKNIKLCREFKKVSRNELASMLNVNVSSISRYELGTREPNMSTINNISNALEVEIDALLNGFSKDIYTRDDVFSLYNKLNTKTKLSKFLGFTDDYDIGFMALKEGAGSIDLYFKLGGYLNLTDNQIYNWILSDCITSLIGYNDFKVSKLNYDDIKYIIDNNILKKQSVYSLVNIGLSKENEEYLKKYLSERDSIKLKNVVLNDNKQIPIPNGSMYKPNSVTINLAYESLVNLILYINKEDYLCKIHDKEYRNLLMKVCDLLEFEIFKLDKKEGE